MWEACPTTAPIGYGNGNGYGYVVGSALGPPKLDSFVTVPARQGD